MEAIEKIKRGKYTLKIYQDENAESPREWENDSPDKMICFHNRYRLGDKHDYNHNDYSGWDEMEAQLRKDFEPAAIFPLYLYDHSGISISIGSFIGRAQHAEWDSGRVGFILVPKKRAIHEWGKKKITPTVIERAENWCKGQVETYDQYLRGDIYGFRLFETIDGDEEEIDSCWGFYGDDWEENGMKDHMPDEFINYKKNEELVSVS